MTRISDATQRTWVAPRILPLASTDSLLATSVFFTVFGANFLRNLFGWWGWAAIVITLIGFSVAWIIRSGNLRTLARLPKPLLAFIAFAGVSIAWSEWPAETGLGTALLIFTIIGAIPIALSLSWTALMGSLSYALRLIVALSLAFEVFVSVVVRHPVLPLYITDTTWRDAAPMLLWSRNLLFETGKIQGVVGNSSVLAGVALLAFIVVAIQVVSHALPKRYGIAWLIIIGGTLALTQSATMAIAGTVVTIVFVLAMLRRVLWRMPKRYFYTAVWTGIAGVGVVAWVFWGSILQVLGKSDDLTGRFEIWKGVINLAIQHPIDGWGWIGYWAPWVSPLNTIASNDGVVQLHAHNAWVDLWMQVGVIGMMLFLAFSVVAGKRSLTSAVHRVHDDQAGTVSYRAITMLPLLLITVLAVQSFTESRLIIEEGLLLLAVLSIKLRLDPFPLEIGPHLLSTTRERGARLL